MAIKPPPDWVYVGRRVSAARAARERTLAWLSEHTQIAATELQQIEAGQCELRPAQLVRMAKALEVGVDWFVTESPPAVRSLRAERIEGPSVARIDLLLEGLARDVELLRSLGTLPRPKLVASQPAPGDGEAAEVCARTVRGLMGGDTGPLLDLDSAAERLGVHTLCIELSSEDPDGAYVALESGGVVVINGKQLPGRRRFTLAHEIGHHVFQDQYSSDWLQQAGSLESEKLINAFAVHLLLPREGVTSRWNLLVQTQTPQSVALRLAVEYRVSWSVMCAQAERLRLIDKDQFQDLRAWTPSRADYMQHGLRVQEELKPPSLSPVLSQAILAAHRKNLLSGHRAIEMLRGTLEHEELPPSDQIPLQAYLNELEAP